MCATCGCSGNGHQLKTLLPVQKPGAFAGLTLDRQVVQPTEVQSEIPAVRVQTPPPPVKTLVELERDILDKNKRMAERNRGFFEARNIRAINLVSSPGSGKTALLERTLAEQAGKEQFYVIEGDQQTTRDAERIAAGGAPVVQINTGKGCHLEADMVHQAIRELQPATDSVVFIENVGNLVCPSMFDLGESRRVVVISVTEGEDKPIKYPDMFHTADLCVINKIDLLPYLKFDVEQLKEYARQVNPKLEFLEVSATTGAGMDGWYAWLSQSWQ
ncbi:MAG: hydrogenase nickel incorporation protein HypB [Saprospiraceae bacterium]|nr:hydrogenase nickel incorporation protein HypB [Lewinellaceae bacterium]